MENHVIDIELSKKLKELGVKQDSEFYWMKFKKDIPLYDRNGRDEDVISMLPITKDRIAECSAFMVTELIEMLPLNASMKEISQATEIPISPEQDSSHLLKINFQSNINNDKRTYLVFVGGWKYFESNTLIDALAKALIYLIENNIWKPK